MEHREFNMSIIGNVVKTLPDTGNVTTALLIHAMTES
ncbi:MAG: hypothetical protein BWY68_00835 [bacterium ADurb.Bin400]|nr:MAG: hypothetical protein BWY68_00835 [bacterium ADurb.Bin400]